MLTFASGAGLALLDDHVPSSSLLRRWCLFFLTALHRLLVVLRLIRSLLFPSRWFAF